MVDETRFERFEAKHDEPDLEDRERMTERALAAIRNAGPASALEKCQALVDQINAELLQREQGAARCSRPSSIPRAGQRGN